MKLLRHLLSYLLLVIVLFGIVTLYYFRQHILPINYVQKIDNYAGKIHPALVSFASSNDVVAVTQSETEQSGNKTDKETVTTVVADKANPEVTVPDVTVPEVTVPEVTVIDKTDEKHESVVVEETKAATENQAAAESNKTDSSNAENEPGSIPPVTVTVDNKIGTDKDISTNVAPSTDKEYASSAALLKIARIAYQEGNPHVAIKIYKELIELENDEADFYGELGNVYYAIGKWDEAGLAYYQAATRLIEQNKFAQVGYLQRVIQGLNAEQAEKLAEQLSKINQ